MKRLVFLLLFVSLVVPGPSAQSPAVDESVQRLLDRLKEVVTGGDARMFMPLVLPGADESLALRFADESVQPGATRVVLIERDRGVMPAVGASERLRLIVDAMVEYGPRARVVTWRLDLARPAGDARADWKVADQEVLSRVDGLHRLSLNPAKQFIARNLVVTAEDFTLRLASGTMFVAEADGVTTAVVLRGRGEMVFAPVPEAERGQLAIFSGSETLQTPFDSAYIRIQPSEFGSRFSTASLTPQEPVDRNEFRRAQEIFDEYSGQSYALDLAELSPYTWSLLPSWGDFYADVHTRRFDTLTYARSGGDSEDISLFDRKRKRNISIYASQRKLAYRGPFYDEDDEVDYDVGAYDIDASFDPAREWIEGTTRLRIKTRRISLSTLTLRLSQYLTVRSIFSDQFGRLLHLRVKGQDSMILNFPSALPPDSDLVLTIAYSGRLAPQGLDREALQQSPPSANSYDLIIPPEPQYLYSNRSYWYPQSTVTDYATANLRLTVPGDFACIATGEPSADGPVLVQATPRQRRTYVFRATQPVRYLSALISRFSAGPAATVSLEPAENLAVDQVLSTTADGTPPMVAPGVFYRDLLLTVQANPRLDGRLRDMASRTAAVLEFYTSLVDDFPYQSFTLAVVESTMPGGHSPGYFAMLNHPLPTSPFIWRADPVNFDGFSDFYLAHELAHQWWGQAVGWKNYHEQWLSEGLAQYFAAMYAEESRGPGVFGDVIRQMRRTAMETSDQGPVHLGYRLGHIQGQGRIFRALVYNKGASVLHMLRGLLGDEVFFRGLRRFYTTFRFRKAGTEDLRKAFEVEAGRTLERFFDRWIYGSRLPTVTFSHRTETGNATAGPRGEEAAAGADPSRPELVLRFEQSEEVFDLPMTATLTYVSGQTSQVTIPLVERIVETRIPLAGPLRNVEINRDNAALAHIRRP